MQKSPEKNFYVSFHFTARFKATGIRHKVSGKSKIQQNDDIFSIIRKTPEKALYFGFHFTGIRSKATGIRTKITGIRSKITEVISKFTELRTESTGIYME